MNVVGPADTEGDNGSWETRYCNEQQYFSELQNQIMIVRQNAKLDHDYRSKCKINL